MNRKILFFDIDGTLVTAPPCTIPESTAQAITQARKNGHLCFINTGRIRVIIPKDLLTLGFDGYVCGCGTQIYMNGQLLFSQSIPHDQCVDIVKKLRQFHIPTYFERCDAILYDGEPHHHPVFPMIRKMAPTENIAEYTGEKAATYTFDKYLVSIEPDSDRAGFEKYVKENDMICFDHGHDVWEVTLAKYTKATGIQFLLDHLGMSLEDSFAFGDSTNDLAMLKYAGTSIAMGNSMPEIFPFCTYRTTGITDNGIWNAMKHFQLI